ncbi:MAG TPA: response regulator transcription factor [Chloroflexota bacterium]|jgi:DNA-binding NarL/FixJ family response regulator
MTQQQATVRVVLADDHALVREGTAELLERAGGIRVIGQAADGLEAVRLVQSLRPDVLLLDVAMPGLDGLEVARRVRQASPATVVVALSAHDEQAYVLAMLEAGARGYLSKTSRGQQVVQAVRAAAAGETVFSGTIGARLTRRALGEPGASALTPREMDVLRAAARGLGNKQIANELGMSARTVQTHLTRVFAKLGVASRTEAVLRAMREGWLLSPTQENEGTF